jgi:putative transposase
LVETPHPTLARRMRALNGVYAQRFNRRHGRPGHLFQGRYGAVLVERDSHLLELCRYVVLNPVRARMVAGPGDWPWGSYRATAGLEAGPGWLRTGWTLARFEADEGRARASYAALVAEGARPVWDDLRGQIYLGTAAWAERMRREAAASGAPREVPRGQRLPEPAPLAAIAAAHADDRRAAMRAAYAAGGHTLRAIARHFGVHESTVSRAVRAGGGGPLPSPHPA